MPKKTARATRPSQQRSKEEQWRKRMAAQARPGGAGALVERDGFGPGADTAEMAAESTQAQTTTRSRASSATATARTQTASAAMQRRASTTPRGGRARFGANTLTIDEEMRYIKGDIRRLIILTAICLAIIIILSIIVPSI